MGNILKCAGLMLKQRDLQFQPECALSWCMADALTRTPERHLCRLAQEHAAQAEALTAAAAAEFAALVDAAVSKAATQAPRSPALKVTCLSNPGPLTVIQSIGDRSFPWMTTAELVNAIVSVSARTITHAAPVQQQS